MKRLEVKVLDDKKGKTPIIAAENLGKVFTSGVFVREQTVAVQLPSKCFQAPYYP